MAVCVFHGLSRGLYAGLRCGGDSVILPEKISYAVFMTADGRLSTEAQTLMVKARGVLEEARNCMDPADIRQAIAITLCGFDKTGLPDRRWCELAGFLAGSLERGDVWRGSIKARIGGFLVKIYGRHLELKAAAHLGKDSLLWTDYDLGRWYVTGKVL